MPGQFDSPSRRTGTYYVEEAFNDRGRPFTPADPNWRLYSDVVTTTEPEPEKEFGLRRGLGNLDAIDKAQALEEHSITVEYELARPPVDAGGNAIDPVGNAGDLTIDNAIATTHSYLQLVRLSSVSVDSTVHEKWFSRSGVDPTSHPTGAVPDATTRPTIKCIYGRGGIPEEPALGINADDNPLITVEYSYSVEMMRPYQFDQPVNGTLYVHSTAAGDTEQTVTIENDDGSTSEELTLDAADATTPVTTTSSFSSLGAVRVPDEHEGTILVYDDDGTGTAAGQLLTLVKGADRYDGIAADHGAPLLGAGSFDDGSTLTGKQYALGAEVLWDGRPLADYHQGSSITLGFEIESAAATNSGLAMTYSPSERNIEVETTTFGQTTGDDQFSNFVEGRDGQLEYILPGADFNITLPNVHPNEAGPGAREEGEAFVMPETTYYAKRDVENGREAIEFTNTEA